MAATESLGFDRPRVFHPAALVDLVNVEVAEESAAGPEEAVESLDLEHDFALPFRFLFGKGGGYRAVHAVGAHVDDVADLAILDAVEKFLTAAAVPHHETDAALEVLGVCFLREFQHAHGCGRVGGKRLFHEDVQAALDGVGKVYPAEGKRCGQNDNIARIESVHRLTVGIEPDELALSGNIDLVFIFLKSAVHGFDGTVQLVLKNISDSDQFRFRIGNRQGLLGGTASASAATDERHFDLVSRGSKNVRDGNTGERRCSGGGFDEISAARKHDVRLGWLVHGGIVGRSFV